MHTCKWYKEVNILRKHLIVSFIFFFSLPSPYFECIPRNIRLEEESSFPPCLTLLPPTSHLFWFLSLGSLLLLFPPHTYQGLQPFVLALMHKKHSVTISASTASFPLISKSLASPFTCCFTTSLRSSCDAAHAHSPSCNTEVCRL